MKKIKVSMENIRIDIFLVNKLKMSRNKITTLIKNKLILVNKKEVRSSYLLKQGDLIEIDYKEEEINPIKMDLDIIYEDDDLIIINKDKGVVVHPGSGNKTKTLVNGLLYYTNNLSDVDETRKGIVHRLDAWTSGLLVVAKNNDAHQFLSVQFKERKVIRKYVALVHGVIYNDSGTIDAPIGRDLKNRQKYTVTSVNSKEAITHFKVLKRFGSATLIEVELETGRTHQIRVHFQYINHPLVNDPIYSFKKPIDNSGQCLHAKLLSFIHPKTKEYVTWTSDIHSEFKEKLKMFEVEN